MALAERTGRAQQVMQRVQGWGGRARGSGISGLCDKMGGRAKGAGRPGVAHAVRGPLEVTQGSNVQGRTRESSCPRCLVPGLVGGVTPAGELKDDASLFEDLGHVGRVPPRCGHHPAPLALPILLPLSRLSPSLHPASEHYLCLQVLPGSLASTPLK